MFTVTILLLGVLSGCGNPHKEEAIEVMSGEFPITPQEFIDKLNSNAKIVSEKSGNVLLQIPDFTKTGEKLKLDDGVTFIFETGDSDNIRSISLEWYERTASEEGLMTAGFHMASIPAILNPATDIDLYQMLDIKQYTIDNLGEYGNNSGMRMLIDKYGEIRLGEYNDKSAKYSYIELDRMCSLDILPY